MENSTASKSLTAICMEVADPEIMEQWFHEGWMPNLARLRAEGLWTRLESVPHISSGAIWPTFFTGVDPSEHGQFFTHMQLKPGTYDIVKMYADDVPLQPFWLELQRMGGKCAIIDVPQTCPQENFNGIHIAGWGGEYPAWPPSSSPESLFKEVSAKFGKHPLANQYRVSIKPESSGEYDSLADDLIQGVQKKAALTRWIFDKGPHDFFLSVFSESHWAMHLLWDLLHQSDAAPPRNKYIKYVMVFKEIVNTIDRLIGELRAARPETDVMVFSLSGMGPNYSGWHVLPDVLDRIGMGPVDKGKKVARFFSPTQRWGSWKTRVIERIVSPRAIQAAKAVVPWRYWDRWTRRLLHANNGWQDSRAFCVPNDYSGAIRINLAGREPRGKVRPGSEYQSVCDEIRQALLELRHPEDGSRVVKEVVQTNRVFSGRLIDALPDLLVIWENKAPVSGVTSSRVGEILKDFPERRTGAHRPWGFFAAAGPHINHDADLEKIHLLDLAPTMLNALGVRPPAHFKGRTLFEMSIDKTPP